MFPLYRTMKDAHIGDMSNEAILQIELPGLERVRSGKVREIFDIGEALLMIATDRISAFDVVMPKGIPRKGEVLTQLSAFWFERFKHVVPNQLIAPDEASLLIGDKLLSDNIARRAMVVKKAKPLVIECVVRGYLAGSGWKEYQRSGTVCGIELPAGLREADELPSPVFTPATKAETGHDENIPFAEAVRLVGKEAAEKARALSLELYDEGRARARSKGIIIADTKFEFGHFDGELILIDEVLTPDSSRFWPADQYEPGHGQPSFDKQFVRDYLESVQWDKRPPAPMLPDEIVAKTMEKYLEAYERLVGRPLDHGPAQAG